MSAKMQGNAVRPADDDTLALDLASLGYPGLSHLKPRCKRKNSAEVMLSLLSVRDLDSRLVEALPWVLLNCLELDWQWLMTEAKASGLQNRLGFVTSVARRLAEINGESAKSALLDRREAELEQYRLECEDTLCHDSLTDSEKRWLRERRSEDAKRWGILSDLSPEYLSYAA